MLLPQNFKFSMLREYMFKKYNMDYKDTEEGPFIHPPFLMLTWTFLFFGLYYPFWLIQGAAAAVYSSTSNLQDEYDFIIVGAGAAGNVLANRLTEDSSFSVLVIEAGVTYAPIHLPTSSYNNKKNVRNEGVLSTIVPFLAPSIQPQSAVTWNYTTVPQEGLNGRALFYSRGKILGGSSSISEFSNFEYFSY
jgi:hypothetical protein